uniref:Gag-like protein n=1 Tax=Phallusia mammillata TaxID=59560 RepID=A0A6F9DRL7_9ASCI|nr:gag-like protein [Phallusia mammillata]
MEKASESYAQATVKSAGSALRRPNCLSFKADRMLKREDLWKLLKEIDFPIKKVLGIAEMKGTQVDVTCTTRQNVLELQNKLAEVEYIKSIRLYESDIINVGIGWVPIPFNNEVIAEALSQRYGEVKKMTHRKDKEGLLSGMRIASMNKSDISVNPIPSYITIHGYEFYITYHGQQFTCKYCGEAGHKQVNCPKRKNDYPQLQNKTNAQRRNHGRETNETGSNLIRTSSPAPLARVEADPDKTFPCVGLQAGKDKQHNHENYTNIEAPTTTGHLSPRSEDNNPNLQKTNLKKRFRTSPEILPNSKSQSLCETPTSLICPECHTESFLAPDSTHFFCYKCKNDFSIVKACCDEETSILVPIKEKTINCPKCQSLMRWMPCCQQFQPEFTTEGNLFECIQCERYSIACVCKTINPVPHLTMSKECSNYLCKCKLIHCSCGKKSAECIEPSKPYRCSCGFEYEWDMDLGVERI